MSYSSWNILPQELLERSELTPISWVTGFTTTNAVRYIGTYLATGAYVSNWAAMNAYQANNIVGQWKRATFAASITACNGLGGIAGSFIFRQNEAPRYVKTFFKLSFSFISTLGAGFKYMKRTQLSNVLHLTRHLERAGLGHSSPSSDIELRGS
jgi:hypothetical protein